MFLFIVNALNRIVIFSSISIHLMFLFIDQTGWGNTPHCNFNTSNVFIYRTGESPGPDGRTGFQYI